MRTESKDAASRGKSGDMSKRNRTVRELDGTRGACAEKSRASPNGPDVGDRIDGAIQTRVRSGGKEKISFGPRSGSFVLTTDRKSTRLNSSHVEISYAVFCLKKKKIRDTKKESIRI